MNKPTLICPNHSSPSQKKVDSCMKLLASKSAIKISLNFPQKNLTNKKSVLLITIVIWSAWMIWIGEFQRL